MVVDVLAAWLAMWLAFTLRLEVWHWPTPQQVWIYIAAPLIFLPLFIRFGLYRAIFRYTGLATMQTLLRAARSYGTALLGLVLLTFPAGVPRSVGVLQPILFLVLVSNSRAWARFWLNKGAKGDQRQRLLIYGAGSAGAQTAAAVANAGEFELLGFVDDDVSKMGRHINGVSGVRSDSVLRNRRAARRLGHSACVAVGVASAPPPDHRGAAMLAGAHSHTTRNGGSRFGSSVDVGLSRTGPRGPAWARSGPAQPGPAGPRPCWQGGTGDRRRRQHRFGACLARSLRSIRPSCCSSSTTNSGCTRFTRSWKRTSGEIIARPTRLP